MTFRDEACAPGRGSISHCCRFDAFSERRVKSPSVVGLHVFAKCNQVAGDTGGRCVMAPHARLPWEGSPLHQLCERHQTVSTWANKITGANAGGSRWLPMRMRWAARIAQFRRWPNSRA